MAKQTGLGDYLAVDDSGGTVRDISNDIGDYGINIAQELVEMAAYLVILFGSQIKTTSPGPG